MSHRLGKRSVRSSVRSISIRKRPLTITALTVALLLTSVSFALGNSGSVSTSITPAAGLPANGSVASTDTSIVTSVTRSQGNAQLQTGVTLARIEVAPSFATHLKVSFFWTDPYDAGKVLSNPNAQISVGLYHPIHTGTCFNQPSSTVATYVTVTDGNGNTYCSMLDTSATGSSSVSAKGKLLISKHIPGGYLLPTVADNGSLSLCAAYSGTASGETSLGWCEPSATAAGTLTTSGPGVLYVVASVVTPGGAPIGQQTTLNTLNFFIDAVSG